MERAIQAQGRCEPLAFEQLDVKGFEVIAHCNFIGDPVHTFFNSNLSAASPNNPHPRPLSRKRARGDTAACPPRTAYTASRSKIRSNRWRMSRVAVSRCSRKASQLG